MHPESADSAVARVGADPRKPPDIGGARDGEHRTAPPPWLVRRPEPDLASCVRAVMSRWLSLRAALSTRAGISPGEMTAMEHLMAEPLGPVELSRRLDLTSAAATLLVDRLERAGHVQRQPHPSDGRRIVVAPTRQGESTMLEQLEPMVTGLDALEAALDAAQREVVQDYLAGVLAVMDAVGQSAGGVKPGS